MPLIDLGPAEEIRDRELIDLGLAAPNAEFDDKLSGEIYDASVDAQIPIGEAENLYALSSQSTIPVSDGVIKRFGKQYYNASVGNVVTAIGTKSEAAKLKVGAQTSAFMREDFRKRLESGQPVTEHEVEFYAKPYEKGTLGWLREIFSKDKWREQVWKDYEEGKLNIVVPKTPPEEIQKFMEIQAVAKATIEQKAEARIPVAEPEGFVEKVIDAAAGIAGFMTQIAIMKKAAPSMPDAVIWENVNIANGGQFGHGAVMRLTMGGINRLIPGTGFIPAVERGTVSSALFGTTTYLGGGDTVDILINMGIPFAFEGLGLTKQAWANYKNKSTMIQTIKEKAPALKNRPDIEIEKSITDLLTNAEMRKRFAPKKPLPDMSVEVRNYMQQKRYSELLVKANAGNKKAIRELNDYIQGKNIPTYDELLERGFSGDATAFELISLGEYKGGPNEPPALLKMPKTKPTGVPFAEKPKPPAKPTVPPKELQKSVFLEGFTGKITSIRYSADNIVAKAGKKSAQIKNIKKDFLTIKEHYESISDIIQQNKEFLPQLVEIQKQLPSYEKAINTFIKKPSKEGFGQVKAIGDKISQLAKEYGEQFTKAERKEFFQKTPIEKIREQEQFVANTDTRPGSLSASELKNSRERGFITSTKEVLPELRIENQYIPRETDPLAIKARNLVLDNLTRAEKLARSGTNDKAVATASELIKYYGERGRAAKTKAEADIFYDKAAAIANDVAVTLTEAGRAVQAASILGRMTPEGQVRFAAREIQRYNEMVTKKKGDLFGLKKKVAELSAEQTKYILNEMNEITKMPEGKERYIRFQKLQNHMNELVPSPMYKKIVNVWKAGLLTGIKTSGLNIFSNAGHLGMETVARIPASVIDKTISYFTGKRTVTPTIKGLKGGTIEGLGKGFEYLKSGYSERDIGTKLDYRKINFGKGNVARSLQAYSDTVFRILGAEDQPFYYAAKMMSMYEQAKVSAINLGLKGKAAQNHIDYLMQNPTEKMIKFAAKDAEAAVFINNTKLGEIAMGIQRLPGGEIVVPFGRTPSAVAMQIINYSPIGAAKTIIENIGKGRFDQRTFSQELGRSLTGTAVLVIGATLYDAGLISLDRPTTEKEIKLWELEGRQPNSVYIAGKWRTVQTFGPAGNLLIIGGHFKRAFEETGSPTEAMTEAMAGSGKTFTEQTFVMGVNQFIEALSDPQRSAPFVAGNMISSIIPTIVSDIARATDVTERRAETVPQKLLARLPGARQTLEPKITVLGEEKEPTSNPIELMIDPTRPTKDISTPVVSELRRLWEEGWEVSPNLLGTRTGYEILTQAENTELWKRAGFLTKKGLTELIENPLYKEMPDERKAELITRIINESQTAAKTEAVAKKLSTAEDEELTNLIFELRKSGLASQEIIPIALSKRNPRKARMNEF